MNRGVHTYTRWDGVSRTCITHDGLQTKTRSSLIAFGCGLQTQATAPCSLSWRLLPLDGHWVINTSVSNQPARGKVPRGLVNARIKASLCFFHSVSLSLFNFSEDPPLNGRDLRSGPFQMENDSGIIDFLEALPLTRRLFHGDHEGSQKKCVPL